MSLGEFVIGHQQQQQARAAQATKRCGPVRFKLGSNQPIQIDLHSQRKQRLERTRAHLIRGLMILEFRHSRDCCIAPSFRILAAARTVRHTPLCSFPCPSTRACISSAVRCVARQAAVAHYNLKKHRFFLSSAPPIVSTQAAAVTARREDNKRLPRVSVKPQE